MKITIKKKPPVETYSIGQVIGIKNSVLAGIYLIAQVGNKEINLIDLKDGNRLNETLKVKDARNITVSEIRILAKATDFEVVEAELIIT